MGACKKRRARGSDSHVTASLGIDAALGERGPATGISQSGFRTAILRERLLLALPPAADGLETAPAMWDVMCRLEKMLRERRDAIAARGLRSHVELLDVG